MSRTLGLLFCHVLPLACFASRQSLQSVVARDSAALVCSGNGGFRHLFDWTCVCNAGWTGSDCSVQAATAQNVSAACYHPAGDDGAATCTWYKDCLSERFPGCKDHALEYAESYGHKYCSAFVANSHKFSAEGQMWIEKVKLCLQEELVKDVMGLDSDCEQIRKIAFDSHPKCYVQPDPNQRSIGICSLLRSNWGDIAKLLETTWDALFSKESIDQMLDVVHLCGPFSLAQTQPPSREEPSFQDIRKQLAIDGYDELAHMV